MMIRAMAALALSNHETGWKADEGDQLVDDAEVEAEHQPEDRRVGDLADDDRAQRRRSGRAARAFRSGEFSSTAMTVAIAIITGTWITRMISVL